MCLLKVFWILLYFIENYKFIIKNIVIKYFLNKKNTVYVFFRYLLVYKQYYETKRTIWVILSIYWMILGLVPLF